MNDHKFCVVTVIVAGLSGGVPSAQADHTDALLSRVGEFQLDNGESKTVIRRKEGKDYRVCMEARPEAVPLKVTYDGKEAIVEPGQCQLIHASNIKLATATTLNDGMTLIGRIKRDSTQPSVSVAQETGND